MQAQAAAGKASTVRVTRCDCRKGARPERLLEKARIPKRYEHCDLISYDPYYQGADTSLLNLKFIATGYVEHYPQISTDSKNGLLITGSVGSGKTHIAVGIIKALIEHYGVSCLFVDYRELLKQIQDSYNPTVENTELGILRPIFEADVLVIDELGAVKPTAWVWDTVGLILNTRYNDKKPTIITTNYPDGPEITKEVDKFKQVTTPDTLGDRIGERMRSRIHEMCRIVQVNGADFRQRVPSSSLR
jgi:DNA replication protein DnaC